eukprot:18842-Heterococcus_DN1.PRE.1
MDVRLCFANAQRYNAQGSGLWSAAQVLSREFERLFAAWVLSVADVGATVHSSQEPKGRWDEWEVLRYFDAVPGCAKCVRAAGAAARKKGTVKAAAAADAIAEAEEEMLPL